MSAPTNLATIQRNVRASFGFIADPQRMMCLNLKQPMPFGPLFIHLHHICGRGYEVTYSMQGVDTDPELDKLLEPIFRTITEGLQTIRNDWDGV